MCWLYGGCGRMYDKKKKLLTRLEEQLVKLEVQATDKVSVIIPFSTCFG